MRILKTILSILGLFIVALLFIGLILPCKDTIVVTKTLNCADSTIFEQVNTYKNWEKWSPWNEDDKNMKITYNEIPSGTGAKYAWSGNEKVSFGEMAILNSVKNKTIEMQLVYEKNPPAITTFNLAPNGDKTDIIWDIKMTYPENKIVKMFLGGYIHLMANHYMNEYYTRGLNNIEKLCQSK